MQQHGTYPFGDPMCARPPSADDPRSTWILGAYPSALHVRWEPPTNSGLDPVAAFPVADEPTPFWNGVDAAELIERWIAAHALDSDVAGRFRVPKGMNGTSGAWVDVNVLAPLELSRDDVWITDCLDTYRTSVGVRNRLGDTYDRGRSAFGWPAWDLPVHPSESEIVTEAVTEHEDRLRSELQACRPERVITLGNAALRVFRHLCRSGPKKLVADVTYGSALDAGVDGRTVQWLPLAHPAAPKPYQAAHVAWIQRFARRDET